MEDYQVEASRAVEPRFYWAPTPPQMTARNYQFAGVEYITARKHGLIGDAPGVGKTAQCIMVGNAIEAKRTLVVCPASLRLNWEKEIWQWSTLPNVTTYPIAKASDGVSTEANYVIISYDLLRNVAIFNAIMDLRWDHLILDEAHALKDPKGNKRTRLICAPDCLPSVVGRITMASGTILPNQPIECLGPLTLVLTNRGWRPILKVSRNDLVWDGVEWVKHNGLVFRGVKRVVNVAGVSATPDHILLSGDKWVRAELLGHNENILCQALVTGSARLPSSTWRWAEEGGYSKPWFNAIAEARLSHPLQRTSLAGGRFGAGPVEQRQVERQSRIISSAETSNIGVGYLAESRTLCSGAITLKQSAIEATEAGESKFIGSGERIEASFFHTLSRYLGGTNHIWKSIASMLTRGINQGTCGLLLEKRTQEIGESSGNYNSESMSLSPVYDLVNAGPRQRFTILSDRGPLIAHNCYNAVRLLDWEAINCASLDSFREFYYDVGGGMIRGPVLEQGDNGPYWVNKLHYSDTVRNVPRNESDLQFRLRKHVMVRRLKEDVLHELPRKQYHPFPLALTSEIRAALKHPGWGQVEKLYEMDATDFDDQSIIDGEVSTARRLLGEAKVESVCKYIIELLEEGVEKVVVSAHHKTVLAVAKEKLTPYGLAYMDGSTPVARRQAAVDKFQKDPACRVILGQMQVIGEGHTLTAAQDVVAIEPSWVPSHLEQFADRCHRYGQKGDYVLCHLPIVPNSLDERIVARAVEKITTIHKALDARSA